MTLVTFGISSLLGTLLSFFWEGGGGVGESLLSGFVTFGEQKLVLNSFYGITDVIKDGESKFF